jgi:hypothetical protein
VGPRIEVSGTVASATASTVTADSIKNVDDDYFNNCVLTFVTGNNAEESRTISDFDSSANRYTLDVAGDPLPFVASDGDQFTVAGTPPEDTYS